MKYNSFIITFLLCLMAVVLLGCVTAKVPSMPEESKACRITIAPDPVEPEIESNKEENLALEDSFDFIRVLGKDLVNWIAYADKLKELLDAARRQVDACK